MPVQLSVTLRNAELVSKALEDLAAEIPKVSAGRIYGRLEGARIRLVRYPPKYAGGPFPWVSPKQRRYVMWAIRNGIIQVPYKRTGTYGDAWQVIKVDLKSGVGYQLRGRAAQGGRDYTKYVSGSAYGTDQARIHQGRWPLLRDVVEESLAQLPKEIADSVVMVARRKGFQTGGAG